jgi:hypothetical protein
MVFLGNGSDSAAVVDALVEMQEGFVAELDVHFM